VFGMTVEEVLALPVMSEAHVLAGESGLHRVVERLNMMEVPDVLPWVRPGELLVTSGYPLREMDPQGISGLTHDLANRGLSGLCIKLGRFLSSIPSSVVHAADRDGFPIVAMPPALAFTDLLGAVMGELLDRQAAALRASDEIDRVLVQLLVAGGGHSEIVDRLAQWLGGAVAIADEDGVVVASSGQELPAKLLVPGGPARLRLRALPRGGDDVVASDGRVAVARVHAGSSRHGYLLTALPDGALSAGQQQALRRAAPVVALAFSRDSEIRAVEARFQGDFLRDLLVGVSRAGDDPVQHAERLGWRLTGDLVVALADPPARTRRADRGSEYAHLASALGRAIGARWPGAVVHGFAAEVVAVLPAAALERPEVWLAEARAHLSGAERQFLVGVSRAARGIGELPSAYRQASEALHAARRGTVRSQVVRFDDIGLARLLAAVVDTGEGERLVTDVIGPLLADRNGEALTRTLECFLQTNCNVAATARALQFHYNTVRLRVARIEELVGPFVDVADRRAELLAACRLRHTLRRPV
jgi:purine catabolism regulator